MKRTEMSKYVPEKMKLKLSQKHKNVRSGRSVRSENIVWKNTNV